MTPDTKPSPADGGNDTVAVEQFQKRLSTSGSGGGVALHFDAEFAAEYELDPDTEVVVEVIEREGDVTFQIEGIPAGFTHEDLVAYAERCSWERTDRYVDEERNEWFLTYRTSDGSVAIEIDSESQIDGNVVNNVTIRSDPIEVTGDFDRYDSLCGVAQRKDLDLTVDDSEGLWQRLRAHGRSDVDDAPDRDTFAQLSDAADRVSVRFVDNRSSLNTTLEAIGRRTRQIQDAYSQFEG
jgi:hypothetical protein